MENEKSQFLEKDVTIKKKNNSYVRGICTHENNKGVTIKVSNKLVFVPYSEISEIVFSGGKYEQ